MTPNTSGATVGSYALTASSASGVQINTVSVQILPGGLPTGDSVVPFQNLRLMINGTQFGTTQAVLGLNQAQTAGNTYVFSGSPFTVPAGGTTVVNVVADTLSNATGTTASNGATKLTGCTGTGLISYNSVSCSPSSVTGQDITFNANGTTLAITSDFSQQASTQYVMPSQQVSLATFDLSENKNIEPVKLTQLTITDAVANSGVKPGFSNIQLYNGATSVAQTQSAVSNVGAACTDTAHSGLWCYRYTFSSFGTSLVVPQNGTLPLILKGDLPNWTAGAVTDDTQSTFYIATSSDVTALGASSSKAPQVTLTSANGNPMTVLRTTLTPALAAVGGTRSARSTQDQAATVTLTANSAGPATLQTMTLTMTGSLISSTADFLGGVQLWLNGTQLSGAQAVATTTGNTITWQFLTGSATGTQIAAGASDVFQVVIDDNTGTATGQSGVSLGLNIALQATSSVTYMDSSLSDSSAKSVVLPANIVPVATQISFGQGV